MITKIRTKDFRIEVDSEEIDVFILNYFFDLETLKDVLYYIDSRVDIRGKREILICERDEVILLYNIWDDVVKINFTIYSLERIHGLFRKYLDIENSKERGELYV